MEGNKDESEKCLRIAEKYVRNGEKEKAIKFLQKAEKLYPSDRAKELLAALESMNGSAASGADDRAGASSGHTPNGFSSGASGSTEGGDGDNTTRKRTTSGGSDRPEVKNYTQKQVEEVRKIRKCKDYYEILGIAKDCSDEEMKKSYRKLALKFHPDKNHAPGATEAFKAIGNAFGVLNDPEKRRRYDQYGLEEDRPTRHSRGGFYEYDYSRGFEGDISAEELFNMFFGGGFQTSHMNHHPRQHRGRTQGYHFHANSGHQQQSEPAYTLLLQLAPILFLVLLSLLSSFLVSDPLFSLEPTQKYSSSRETQNLHVPYYVKADFHTEYKGSLRRLEQQVEEEYLSSLRANCFRERSYKENLLWRARNYNDAKLYARAQDLKTPSCDRLNEIYS